MEGLEVEDISPALEVTEDFLHCLDGGPSEKLQEVSAVGRLNSSGVWGLLVGEQLEVSPRNLAWADQPPSFGLFSARQGKRSRARSTNDLAAHAKDAAGSSSNAAFKRGHNRSRSDANYRSYTDNGVPTVDKNTLKNMTLNDKRDVITSSEVISPAWTLWNHSCSVKGQTYGDERTVDVMKDLIMLMCYTRRISAVLIERHCEGQGCSNWTLLGDVAANRDPPVETHAVAASPVKF
ncbi:hypothetical protein SKAU_G00243490 [Synaphobranchus kaupii]|uniref:Uncharacterized protein n=1 Tax=Synaphobranchus kaupii TaxID=118154 RepID=A0A9Q1F853_SYNKA|nr:hypothetical protein SKAU_G00243490 [Synaphobranchus kaupii]